MKDLSKILLLLSLIALCGCTTVPRHQVMGLQMDPVQKSMQNDELKVAEGELEASHFDRAQALFADFKKRNPNSPYFQRAQLGEAKALEHLGEWSQAAELFRDMIEATRTTQPEIAAEALYQSSYCYEALGDEARVFAVLEDAKRMKDSLSPEVALAEIPARLAASHNRTGRWPEAQKALNEADAGITELKRKNGSSVTPAYLARVYAQMGALSTNQLAFENFQASLETLKSVQAFSLRSIEQSDPVFSLRALSGLKTNYRDLYSLIHQVPFNRTLDSGAARREQVERKSWMAGNLLSAIEVLRQNQTPGVASVMSQELFAHLQEIETRLLAFLNSRGELNELTPEALKLKSVKKNIMIESEPMFSNEIKNQRK